MEFGRWYPLTAAAAHAPPGPGVFQVRVRDGLIDYPRGKSAMVHYAAAPDVRAAARDLAAAHPDADWLCRHLVDLADPAAAATLATKLVRDFTARFGRAPGPP
ncbi:MAG: hypothetical protein IPL61_37670 [Myxococcales bacterium]|nr:hypothetical protein [Myxococcales bacterium]